MRKKTRRMITILSISFLLAVFFISIFLLLKPNSLFSIQNGIFLMQGTRVECPLTSYDYCYADIYKVTTDRYVNTYEKINLGETRTVPSNYYLKLYGVSTQVIVTTQPSQPIECCGFLTESYQVTCPSVCSLGCYADMYRNGLYMIRYDLNPEQSKSVNPSSYTLKLYGNCDDIVTTQPIITTSITTSTTTTTTTIPSIIYNYKNYVLNPSDDKLVILCPNKPPILYEGNCEDIDEFIIRCNGEEISMLECDTGFMYDTIDLIMDHTAYNDVMFPSKTFSYLSFPERWSESISIYAPMSRQAFYEMGYNENIMENRPTESRIKEIIQDPNLVALYVNNHGSWRMWSGIYQEDSSLGVIWYYEIEEWLKDLPPVPFTFLHTCDPLCVPSETEATLSYTLRKGQETGTVVVGSGRCDVDFYRDCPRCPSRMRLWEYHFFEGMKQGFSVKEAFEHANSLVPQCSNNCYAYDGDGDLRLVPNIERVASPTLPSDVKIQRVTVTGRDTTKPKGYGCGTCIVWKGTDNGNYASVGRWEDVSKFYIDISGQGTVYVKMYMEHNPYARVYDETQTQSVTLPVTVTFTFPEEGLFPTTGLHDAWIYVYADSEEQTLLDETGRIAYPIDVF